MKKNILLDYDALEAYCRLLGHYVNFAYCRSLQNGLACGRVLDCWFDKIPIKDYIEENYSEDEIKLIFAPSKPKIASLLDLIEKVKKN
jgi:hypothetical protein